MNLNRVATLVVVVSAASFCPAGIAESSGKDIAVVAFELRVAGNVDRAKEVLEEALAKDPKSGPAHLELARACLYAFEFDRALSEVKQAAEICPNRSDYHYWAGLIASYSAVSKAHSPKTKDEVPAELKKSLESYVRSVEIDPNNHEARLQLINLYLENPSEAGASRSEAEKHTKKLESLDAIYGAKARSLLLGEDSLHEQRALWEKVVADHVDSSSAHEELGRVYLHLKDTDKAVPHLDMALKLNAARSEILVDLTRHYVLAEEYTKAEQSIQRYLDLKPAPLVPMRAYGTFVAAKIQKIQHRDEPAEKLLTEARKLDPHFWQTFMQPPQALFDAP